MISRLISAYDLLVVRQPLAALLGIGLVVAFFAWHAPRFELDASADSLVLENDEALKFYRSIREQYGSDDFLVVTYTPVDPLFSEKVLGDIARLRGEIEALEGVDSVVSLLDVPLVESPPMTLFEITRQQRTLQSDDVDLELAETELRTSPLYSNLLVNTEGDTTALQVNLVPNRKLNDLIANRDKLYEKASLVPSAEQRIAELTAEIRAENKLHKQRVQETISALRSLLEDYFDLATVWIGGVPMIAADSISFIGSDLKVFGVGVIAFIFVILALSFRQPRWVILPLGVCLVSAASMVGFLGWANWPVTVVSSNFISLLLIITLSLIIHLVVRYRELARLHPEADQEELVRDTLHSKFAPCLYTAVTTVVAFVSLLVSGIRPVIDFGWMMVIGISVSFVLAFTVFPAVLSLLPRIDSNEGRDFTGRITGAIAEFIHRRGGATLLIFAGMLIVVATGLPRLSVENRFIDYYKEDTEIFQGMTLIDTKLGGTTPMDVIIDAPADQLPEEDLFDALDITSNSYWFNSDGLAEVARIHKYLDELPETGKVLSLHTGMQLLETLNGGEPYSDFKLAVVHKRLPDLVRQQLIEPYLSEDGNQLRIGIRLYESSKSLRRQQLIDKIYTDLTTDFGLAQEQVTVSGMAVLYNNLLQSLFRSQILTLGAVFGAILIMFVVLFRAFALSLAAILPNMLAAGLVLGLMGWIGIPLDIMTITIAAISIGIGVDDSIHYLHRFREEYALDQDYWAAIRRCHASIARAMYYTTVTVVLGFSILALSNFIPTIYFGVLSGLAMLTALLANLMLLPLLLARLRLH